MHWSESIMRSNENGQACNLNWTSVKVYGSSGVSFFDGQSDVFFGPDIVYLEANISCSVTDEKEGKGKGKNGCSISFELPRSVDDDLQFALYFSTQ
jgi:hypothetical protein